MPLRTSAALLCCLPLLAISLASTAARSDPGVELPAAKKGEPISTQPATQPVIDMVFWEKQDGEPGGPSERLTLWADGRSEITVTTHGRPGTPKAGWKMDILKARIVYTLASPYSPEESRKKFSAAVSAGIDQLRTFPGGYKDGSATLVGYRVGDKVTQTVIPMFLHPGEKDNQGSENHARFKTIDSVLGTFETNPTQ